MTMAPPKVIKTYENTTKRQKTMKRSSKTRLTNKFTVDDDHNKEVLTSPPIMECLPTEIISEVLVRVAVSSPVDLFRCKLSCKAFQELSEEKNILQQVSSDNLMSRHSWLTDNAKPFFMKCLANNNPHALIHFGLVQYFSDMMLQEGLKNLEKATEQGNKDAGYVLSLILLCSGDKECIKKGTDLMLNIMRVIRGKGIVECRKKLRNFMRSMWIVNKFIAKTKPQFPCALKQQHEIRNNWYKADYYHEEGEDSVVCESCKIVREVNFFCQLFNE